MTTTGSVKRANWELRELTPDDWAIFREVRLRALADAPEAFGSTIADARRLSEKQWRGRLARRRTFIALADQTTIGIAAGISERPLDAELVSMWVDPAWRGRGVGDALVEAVARWAGAEGLGRLRLWVAQGNVRAERFYTRLGFSRTGQVQPMGKGASGRMELEMVRSLDIPQGGLKPPVNSTDRDDQTPSPDDRGNDAQ